MMSIAKRIAALLLMLTVSIVFNTSFAQVNNELVDQLNNETGVTESFSNIDQVVTNTIANITTTNTKLTDAEKQQLQKIFIEGLSSKKLLSKVNNRISQSMHEDDIHNILELYETELFQKIKAQETKLMVDERVKAFMDYANNINENKPSQKRLQLVEKLDDVTHASENTANMMGKFFATMIRGFNKIENKASEQELDKTITSVQEFMVQSTKQQIKLSCLFAYQDISDDELSEYIAILENNQNMRVYNQAVLDGTSDVLEEFADYIPKEIMKLDSLRNKS